MAGLTPKPICFVLFFFHLFVFLYNWLLGKKYIGIVKFYDHSDTAKALLPDKDVRLFD